MLSPLLFAIVVDVITKNTRKGVVYELHYVGNLVLISKTFERLKERFWNRKDALESRGLNLFGPGGGSIRPTAN